MDLLLLGGWWVWFFIDGFVLYWFCALLGFSRVYAKLWTRILYCVNALFVKIFTSLFVIFLKFVQFFRICVKKTTFIVLWIWGIGFQIAGGNSGWPQQTLTRLVNYVKNLSTNIFFLLYRLHNTTWLISNPIVLIWHYLFNTISPIQLQVKMTQHDLFEMWYLKNSRTQVLVKQYNLLVL